jgi:hypothetical protein
MQIKFMNVPFLNLKYYDFFCKSHVQCFEENITNCYGNDKKICGIFGQISGY